MKRFKKLLEENIWAIVAIMDIAIILILFYMVFGWAFEVAQFHAVMNILAG